MEFERMTCSSCGHTDIVFDPETRILSCNQCGNKEQYSRRRLNANKNAVYNLENALKFFMEGKYDTARKFAEDTLAISIDNAPALYIVSYIEEFVNKKRNHINNFFNRTKDLELDYDEIEELKKLFLDDPYKLKQYEKEAIRLISINSSSERDKKSLCEFIDTLCPYLISKRSSSAFLTNELIEMYADLAKHCSIPKTCYALLLSIQNNPDSPYIGNMNTSAGKNSYFYKNYILPIGKIISNISDINLRPKFVSAFNSKDAEYKQKMIMED